MFRELFYYLVGGVTFLPLTFLTGIIYFRFTCPPDDSGRNLDQIEADLELTQERKTDALDLAATNAAIQAEIESNKGKDRPQGSSTAPATAKRLGPQPATSSSTKPHLAGWLAVRSRFETETDTGTATTTSNAPGPVQNGVPNSVNGVEKQTTEEKKIAAAAAAPGSYMSLMYKGLLDIRSRTGARRTLPPPPTQDATGTSSNPVSGAATPSPTGTAGKEHFHCILKAPILYLYSSDDVSSPNTECHAAIDLRGKRVSIFVSGLGDTMGELESDEEQDEDDNDDENDDQGKSGQQSSARKPVHERLAATAASQWDTQSSAGSDAEAFTAARSAGSKLARKGWKKVKRAAVRDGELFMKRNAIRIVGSVPSRSSRRSTAESGGSTSSNKAGRRVQHRPQWYIFCKSTVSMEDWYHGLLQTSLMPETGVKGSVKDHQGSEDVASAFRGTNDPVGSIFSKEDMASLLVSLDSLPDPIPLRWLNAMVGRIFYSVYRTAWLEDYITRKMMKKISRVRTPGFLRDIKVKEVDVGRRAPAFSRPMLKALTNEGEASMEVACHYTGELRITISTTLTISLGSRFKPYNIPLVLAVVLRSLEGNLLLHVKPPPSNRLWFGFTSLPKMEIDVEPVVSERKVQWGMVTRLIEGRIKELLNESIVVPNMDDVPFFDTRAFSFRGGIFADAAKRTDNSVSAAAAASEATKVAAEPQEPAADVLKNATAKSAPASGAATPKPQDEAEGIVIGDDVSSSSRPERDTQSLRNRKTGEESLLSLSPSLNRIASPAAAGLSDLLTRDLAAASGDKSSLSSSRFPDQQHNQPKRKSWFGSASRALTSSSTSSIPGGRGSGSGTIRAGRGGREQSSLAWGNASLSNVPSRSTSSSVPLGKSTSRDLASSQTIKQENEVPSRPETHERNKESISSISSSALGTDESGVSASTDQLNESIEAAALESMGWQRDEQQQQFKRNFAQDDTMLPTPTSESFPGTSASSRTPSVMISKASEDAIADLAGEEQNGEGADATSKIEGKAVGAQPIKDLLALQTDAMDVSTPVVDSPSSYNASSLRNRSSASSLRSTGSSGAQGRSDQLTTADMIRRKFSPDLASISSRQTPSELSGDSYDGQPISLAATNSTISCTSVKPAHGFAPPPRRASAAPRDLDNRHLEAATALNPVQQDRYGLGNSPRDASGQSPGNIHASVTAAALLTSWNKAKASMADKESRQVAAQDAKAAIKRGWASWNAKRAEKSGNNWGQTCSADQSNSSSPGGYSGVSSSRSSRLSLVPNRSDWLASSPPDPTSLGAGLDSKSPEKTREFGGEAERRVRLRQSLGDDAGNSDSARSSSSGRQPYRELRVSKAAQRKETANDLNFAPQWDAQVPSLAAPAPAFRRTESSSTTDKLGSSPPEVRKRKVSGGQSGGVSFIPPAPYTTTGLASTSGFSDSGLSLVDGNTLVSGPSPQPIPPVLAASSKAELGKSPRRDSSHTLPAATASPQMHASPRLAPSPSSSPTMNIKTQPGRAQMMAVPGIPSMQKSGPQSFSAPPPPEDLQTKVAGGNMFKLTGAAVPQPADKESTQPEPETGLGLTNVESAGEEATQLDTSFAEVASAQSPAVDSDFASAQKDMGHSVQLDNTEVKLDDDS